MSESTRQRIEAVAPLVREQAAAGEAAGRLTEPVLAAMREAGVFRMTMGKRLGGPELDPLEQIEVIEALAAADGSAGWCGMINSDGGYMAAYLESDVAAEMYSSLDLPTAVGATPTTTATITGDSYVVSGTSPFLSGSSHADWFFLSSIVRDGNGPRLTADGRTPEIRLVAVPASQVEILPTWDVSGLVATASNTVRVTDVVVPGERTFSFRDGPKDPARLYAWPFMFFANISAVPLGVARAALTEAKTVAAEKIVPPLRNRAAEDPTLHWNLGRAEAHVGSARAYVYDTVGSLWDSLSAGRTPTRDEWTAVRLGVTNAMQACTEAVTLLSQALGTTAVFRTSPLHRHSRDLATMSQHVLSQTKTYANCGRSLLGLEPGGMAFI